LLALMVNFLLMAQLSLEVCRMSWGTFWAAHRPSLLVAVGSGAIAWSVATGLRQLSLPPVATLAVSSGAAFAFAICLVRRFPRQCLGRDGLWTLEVLTSIVAKMPWRSRRTIARAGTGGV
ncbi:MAG: hypothetical protein ACREMX_17250, partial [Gemmatimonadales bacterium]